MIKYCHENANVDSDRARCAAGCPIAIRITKLSTFS